MKGQFVIDASIAIAWAHPAQATEATERLLDRIADGARFAVPALWFLEVANALLALERRKRIRSEERVAALDALLALDPLVDEEGHRRAFREISELAIAHGLTLYDASYLDLALREGVPLITKDRTLRAAARKAGVPRGP